MKTTTNESVNVSVTGLLTKVVLDTKGARNTEDMINVLRPQINSYVDTMLVKIARACGNSVSYDYALDIIFNYLIFDNDDDMSIDMLYVITLFDEAHHDGDLSMLIGGGEYLSESEIRAFMNTMPNMANHLLG